MCAWTNGWANDQNASDFKKNNIFGNKETADIAY